MKQPTVERPLNGGTQKIYRFPNNMGASVVKHSFSYGKAQGLWELAVLRFTGVGIDDYQLDYSTYITDGVLGSLTLDDVEETLNKIERLYS